MAGESDADGGTRDADVFPPCALAWSGGKDAMLALHRARQQGYDVTHLFSIYEGNTGRTRFHGVRTELLEAQARALGLPLVMDATHPDDYEAVHRRLLEQLIDRDVGGVIYGNIHLDDIRQWFEERSERLGLEHVEPLWGDPPAQLVREFLTAGYRTLVVSVDLDRGDPAWLGRELAGPLVDEMLHNPEVDPCGERGEYHTFVWDGPLLSEPVDFRTGETFEREGHRILDLTLDDRAPDQEADRA